MNFFKFFKREKEELTQDGLEMLEGIKSINQKTAKEIMVPRPDVIFMHTSMKKSEVFKIITEKGFSRYPVYDGNMDNVIGVLYVKDLIRYFANMSFNPSKMNGFKELKAEALNLSLEERKLVDSLVEFLVRLYDLSVYSYNSGDITSDASKNSSALIAAKNALSRILKITETEADVIIRDYLQGVKDRTRLSVEALYDQGYRNDIIMGGEGLKGLIEYLKNEHLIQNTLNDEDVKEIVEKVERFSNFRHTLFDSGINVIINYLKAENILKDEFNDSDVQKIVENFDKLHKATFASYEDKISELINYLRKENMVKSDFDYSKIKKITRDFNELRIIECLSSSYKISITLSYLSKFNFIDMPNLLNIFMQQQTYSFMSLTQEIGVITDYLKNKNIIKEFTDNDIQKIEKSIEAIKRSPGISDISFPQAEAFTYAIEFITYIFNLKGNLKLYVNHHVYWDKFKNEIQNVDQNKLKETLERLEKELNSFDFEQNFKVSDIMRRGAYFTPESTKLNQVLKEMRDDRKHIAMLIDEYGGISGIISLENIIEEIVGDIQDEFDEEDEEIIETGEDEFVVLSRASIDEVNETLGLSLPSMDFETIGGFIFDLFSRIPQINEIVKYDDNGKEVEFKVLEISKNRMVKLKIKINKQII